MLDTALRLLGGARGAAAKYGLGPEAIAALAAFRAPACFMPPGFVEAQPHKLHCFNP